MNNHTLLVALLATFLVAAVCANPPRTPIAEAPKAAPHALSMTRELVTEIMIDAAPMDVWLVLTDAPAYGDWNPFIISMNGEFVEGTRLENVLQVSPERRMTFRPTLLEVEAGRALRWLGRPLLPYLFDGEHYFLLDAAHGGTRLVHGERFQGVALWFVDVERFRANFEAMNVALKHRVESRTRQPAASGPALGHVTRGG